MSASHPSDTPVTVDDAKIDRLLHDAEQADSGAMMAGIMRDFAAEQQYRAKQQRDCEVCGGSPKEMIVTATGLRCFDAYACARTLASRSSAPSDTKALDHLLASIHSHAIACGIDPDIEDPHEILRAIVARLHSMRAAPSEGPPRFSTEDRIAQLEARIYQLNRFVSAARRSFNGKEPAILGEVIATLNDQNRTIAAGSPEGVKLVRSASAPLPVPAQEAEALLNRFRAAWDDVREYQAWGEPKNAPERYAAIRDELLARLRSPSEIPEADYNATFKAPSTKDGTT